LEDHDLKTTAKLKSKVADTVEIVEAQISDVSQVLRCIKGLADHVKMAHEVKISEERLAECLFGSNTVSSQSNENLGYLSSPTLNSQTSQCMVNRSDRVKIVLLVSKPGEAKESSVLLLG